MARMAVATLPPETDIALDARLIRVEFFPNRGRPLVQDVQSAFRLLWRLEIRAHHISQGAGGPAGRLEPRVVALRMESPLAVLLEVPAVLQYSSGVAALLLLAERIAAMPPRIKAKREEWRAIEAIARKERRAAE